MRFSWLAALLLSGCARPLAAPLLCRLEGEVLVVQNQSEDVVMIAAGWDQPDGSKPLLDVGLEIFDEKLDAWRWYGEDCRHRNPDCFTVALAPGLECRTGGVPAAESSGRFRYALAIRRPGEVWTWLPVGEFEVKDRGANEPDGSRVHSHLLGVTPALQLRVSNVRPFPDSSRSRFLMDLEIVNETGEPIRSKFTGVQWMCEEQGRWFRHPGFRGCGNVPISEFAQGIGQYSEAGRAWGRLRYGVWFDGFEQQYAAWTEPFDVPELWP